MAQGLAGALCGWEWSLLAGALLRSLRSLRRAPGQQGPLGKGDIFNGAKQGTFLMVSDRGLSILLSTVVALNGKSGWTPTAATRPGQADRMSDRAVHVVSPS